jgi:hypothetical protein
MTQKTWLKKHLAAEMLAAMMVSSGGALAEPLHGRLKFCFGKEELAYPAYTVCREDPLKTRAE